MGGYTVKIGFVSGCFDWLTPGHIRLFQAAREQCDILHMLIADDSTVQFYKGHVRPLLSYEERCELVDACRYIDVVHKLRKVVNYSNQRELIKQIKPHCYFEGADSTDKDIANYLTEFNITRVTLYTEELHVSDILRRYDNRRYDPTTIYEEHITLGEIAGL